MIQKCPNCGTWCETEGSGMLQRFGQGWLKSVENAAETIGGESSTLGNMLGGALGTYTGIVRGGFKSIFGFKYEFHCPNCGNEWGTDDENDDETDEFLEEIEEEQNEFHSSVQAKIDECLNSDRPKEAIKYLEKLIKDSDDEDDIAYLYRRQALIYINYLDDNEAALTACERGIKALAEEEWSSADTFLYYYKYIAEQNLGRTWAARRDALIVYQHAEDEMINSDEGTTPLEEVALDAFNELDEKYAAMYLDFDYKDRRALLTVPTITDVGTTHIDIFHISSLPKNIAFPVGHPVANQVYIGHPYLPEVYLPLETYQYAFVEDRVREFCELAQALGATEITVEALNSSNTNYNGSRDRRASGSASYSGHSASGSYHSNEAHGSVDEKYQTLNFHQEYEPIEPVHLPEKMVWYPHEASWQRLYQQRLKGILSHEERIETRNSQVLSGSELKEIKGEVETIFEANGEWDESMEEKFVQEDNAILSIKVKFAPLSQLTGKQQQHQSQESSSNISSDLKESIQRRVSDAYDAAIDLYNDWIAEEPTSDRLNIFLDRLANNEAIQYTLEYRYFLEALFRFDAISYTGVNNLEQYIKAEVAINEAIVYEETSEPELHLLKGLIAFEPVYHQKDNEQGFSFTEKNKKTFFECKEYLKQLDDFDGLVFQGKEFYKEEYKFLELYFDNPTEFWRKYSQENGDTPDNTLSKDEQDYLETYKEYATAGDISELNRKMLNKFRSRLGISEERARELEESCSKPQLTEDEQEYLEMFKEYAADGEISERDRKMLNKMRDRMGISEERAKEIEKL